MCCTTTPFGLPVLPEVYMTYARCSGAFAEQATLSDKAEQHRRVASARRGGLNVHASSGSEGEPCSMDRASSVEVNAHQGKLIIDATVAEQAIRYPTDLS